MGSVPRLTKGGPEGGGGLRLELGAPFSNLLATHVSYRGAFVAFEWRAKAQCISGIRTDLGYVVSSRIGHLDGERVVVEARKHRMLTPYG